MHVLLLGVNLRTLCICTHFSADNLDGKTTSIEVAEMGRAEEDHESTTVQSRPVYKQPATVSTNHGTKESQSTL